MRKNARGEKLTFGPAELYADSELYVRTAVVRQPGWKEGLRGPRVRTPADVAELLIHMTRLDHERVVALLLDPESRLIAIHEAAVGGLHGCALTPRDVLRLPILVGAARLVLVHNHPSGNPEPSQDDIRMTRAIQAGARAVGVELLDHVVLARGQSGAVWNSIAMAAPGAVVHMTGLEPAADETLFSKSARSAGELALAPYGKNRKFLIRSALVESEDRAEAERPTLMGFDDVLRSGPVRRLRDLSAGEERLVTLCVDGQNRLMAAHVTRGAVHGIEARHVIAVASVVPTGAIVLAHNHPGGDGPGPVDAEMMREINAGLDALGVALLDSIVVYPLGPGSSKADSLLELGMMGR